MSLTTRCPVCGTQFRVVPDQLRISGGWVRCGQCADVFDASAHLQPLVSAQAPSLGTLEAASAAIAPPGRELAAPAPAKTGTDPDSDTEPDRDSEPHADAGDSAHPGEGAFVAGWDADRAVGNGGRADGPQAPAHVSVRLRRADEPDEDEIERATQAALKPAPPREAPKPTPAPAPPADPLDSVSFVQQARRRERWSQRDLRGAAGASLAGLALVLLAQIALHQRDRLAMQWPALKPALSLLCAPLSCEIGAPRQIESIYIDSSGFQRLRPDAYRLTVTLRNQAGLDLAMPALELTLTDTQDQPVVLPGEIAGAPALIGAGGDWSGALTVGVGQGVAATRVAGYRLLAFYP